MQSELSSNAAEPGLDGLGADIIDSIDDLAGGGDGLGDDGYDDYDDFAGLPCARRFIFAWARG